LKINPRYNKNIFKEKTMGKVENSIKSEILRLAKKQVRGAFLPLKREVWKMRLRLSNLSRNFAFLDRMTREQMRQVESKKSKLEASAEEVKVSRFTPARIANLRKKLGLSQRELALLTGVTVGAVGLWEKGKFRPNANKKAILVALRKLNKRAVRKILEEKGGEAQKRKPKEKRAKGVKGKRRFRKPRAAPSKKARRKA
jgi:DNA-binding transcriptional regulator YiaG